MECRFRGIAPPGQEGWLRDQENAASATETAQTGWLFQHNVLSNHPGASRHPSCPGGAMPLPQVSAISECRST